MAKKEIATAARIPGHYDADAVSAATGLGDFGPSLAIESQKEEADINTIVRRFGLTGELPLTARVPFPLDFDCDEILDYRECADRILQAERSFMSLPASVRSNFNNDPIAFADYASDPQNLPKLREWGLAPPAPTTAPTPSPAV